MKLSFLFPLFVVLFVMAAVLLSSAGLKFVVSLTVFAAEKAHAATQRHMARHGLLLTMTTLSTDVARAYEQGDRNHMGVIAADIIYEGAAVGDNGSGYARPLVAGDPFRGFAVEKADNSAGLVNAIKVWLRQKGRVELAISGLAVTDVGKAVYASDDATFTLTATSNSHIGRVIRFVSGGIGVVEFDASNAGLGALTALTDNTTGAASDTLAAISDAATKNAVASLAAKVNALIKYIS